MGTQAVTLEGVVGQDGALTLSSKLDLQPGPVRVTVEPVNNPASNRDSLLKLLQEFAEQGAARPVRRSREEIDADVQALRDEAEEEFQAIERLQDWCRQQRDASSS